MENFLGLVSSVNDVLWTYVIVVILVAAAFYFTLKTRCVQFRYFSDAIKIMLGKDCSTDASETGKIGSFKAFSISLASRVGTGNLAGVASAIFIGGPGAVFWMWVMALLGAATSFVESTLAQLYKRRGEDSFYGGPAYYMESGMGKRWLGIIFSVLMVLSFGLFNQTVQSVTIVDAVCDTFSSDRLLVGVCISALLLCVIVGGVQRIAATVSYMVPFMVLGFVAVSLFIVITNINLIPKVVMLILGNAFGLEQVGGGMVGAAVLQGVKRGLFSNEAGEGSTPNAAATASTSHPVKQGLVQALGVFIDTIVVCTCTAVIILLSGMWNSGMDGIVLTSHAVEHFLGAGGRWFITSAILLFAFSTMIANYYFGETNLHYISLKKWPVWVFRSFTAVFVAGASLFTLQQMWVLLDVCMGLLTLCNVTAILSLSGKAFMLLRDYDWQRRAGKDPQFKASQMEDSSGIECW